jgi:hypothetical protein
MTPSAAVRRVAKTFFLRLSRLRRTNVAPSKRRLNSANID